MAVTENHDKNGMIPKEKLDHVLRLVAIELNSLDGCLMHKAFYLKIMNRIKIVMRENLGEPQTALEAYAVLNKMAKLFDDIYAKNAKNLYEFFYQTKGFDKHGYYAVQFPIDRKKFAKKRVAEKLVKNALRNKKKNALKINEMMLKNKDAFLASLTVKVKRPKIDEIDWQFYKDAAEP